MVKKLLLAALIVVAALAGAAYYVVSDLSALGAHAKDNTDATMRELEVKRGMGPKAIARALKSAGVIDDAERFFRYAHYIKKSTQALKAGEYEVAPSMTTDEIIAVLSTGRVKEKKFTVREGLRKEEIADIISAAGFGKSSDILAAMNAPALVKAFGVPTTGAGGQKSIPGGIEGYLFPDTYQFPKKTPVVTILKKMRARLDEVINDKMKERMKELKWPLHKVLTLAAIVEKETGQPFERPHISSVFHNRMKKKMKMQTDPTVIYGIKNYDGNIRKRDLLTPHPYNTYTMKGLPPGPIASPGREAIEAALWPTDDQDIFFVSKNDGTHIFCPTLVCHETAVQKWQVEYFRKKRRKR